MQQIFQVKAPLRDELSKNLIFGINSRLAAATILKFVGYQHEVMPLMQQLSHQTRAYTINAKGLPGFVKSDIIQILKDAEIKGKLNEAIRWHAVHVETLNDELSNLPDSER